MHKSLKIAYVVAWLGAAAAGGGSAADFPDGVDYLMGLTWDKSPGEEPACLVSAASFHRFGMIIPAAGFQGVFDKSGKPVKYEVLARGKKDAEGVDLWLVGTPDRIAYAGWRDVELQPDAAFRSTTVAVEDPLGEKLPDGFPVGLPVVQAKPGLVYKRPNWRIVNNAVRQISNGRNIYLATAPQFTDGIFSLTVKPGTASAAGFIVRGEDRENPDRNGIYWLIDVAARPDEQGDCKVWGAVLDSRPGPLLRRGESNKLKAVLKDGRIELIINEVSAKTIVLPPNAAAKGSLVLATYGGSADFDDVRVTDADGRELFSDAFSGPHLDSNRWWVTVDDRVRGGFARIANRGPNSAACAFHIAFHKDPWSRRCGIKVAPGGVSEWLWLPSWIKRLPFTISVSAPEQMQFDLATAMEEKAIFSSLAIAPGSSDGYEARVAEFSNASHAPTLAEISAETLKAVQAMQFKGRIPERFPIGYPGGHRHDYEACRLLGFNAVHMTPHGANGDYFSKLGYRYIYTYTHLLTAHGKGAGYRQAINDSEMARFAEQWKAKGLLNKVYRVSVFDEPGDDIAADVGLEAAKNVYMMKGDPDAWTQMMRNAGLRPHDFIDPINPPPAGMSPVDTNYWGYIRIRTILDREQDPQGLLDTMLMFGACYATRFGNLRTAIRQHLGDGVLVTANVHDSHFQRGTLTDIEPWQIYGGLTALDVPQACDYYTSHPQAEEFMIDLMRSALGGRDCPVDAYLASQASYMARPSRSLTQRAFCAIGAGARSISFYNYGPRYAATENWYDTDRKKLQAIGEICHAVGWAEDILLAGRPRPAPIAIMYARNGDLWDLLDAGPVYSTERRNFYHLLRGLNLRADFISDQYLPDSAKLDLFKVIVMAQRCIPDFAADALLGWVERGGHLLALGSCGQLDGLARPTTKMTAAFGIEAIDLAHTNERRAKQPEPKTVSALKITTRGLVANVRPGGAKTAVAFDDGTPAVLARERGKGKLVYFAFLPGHTYHGGLRFEKNMFLDMNEAVRTYIGRLLEPAGPPECAADNPLVSARLITGAGACAIILVNCTESDVLEKVDITVRGIDASSAESLAQGPLSIAREKDTARFTCKLWLADIIRLK